MLKWQCSLCGFIYDEEKGLPKDGVSAGTHWRDISNDWRCPDCGVSKSRFLMI